MVTIADAMTLAVQHHQQGRLADAAPIYHEVLAVQPDNTDALYLLGIIARKEGRLDEARQRLTAAIALRPEHIEAHAALGNLYRDLGRLDQAVQCYQHAVDLKPTHHSAQSNLGPSLFTLGLLDQAEVAYRRMLALDPLYVDAYVGLAVTLRKLNRLDQCAETYQRALALRPADPVIHYYYALALGQAGRSAEAELHLRQALTLQPDYPEVQISLAEHIQSQHRLDEALARYDALLRRGLRPVSPAMHSNMLLSVQYLPGVMPPWLRAVHEHWDACHAAPLKASWRPFANSRDPDRRLRLGFVSPDLGRHPVGFFLRRMLEHLDRAAAETICYSDRSAPTDAICRVRDPRPRDDITARIEQAATGWRNTASLSDLELTQRIRDDGIDILFELTGHSRNNRLLVFARKPAPVQLSWAGYVGTTGLEAIDYVVADRFHIPEGTEAGYREKILRMPDGYICYDPPPDAPAVGPLPAAERGYVTFGGFNNPTKLMPECLAAWAEILRRVPDTRLLLKYRDLDRAPITQWVHGQFAANGIDPARVELQGAAPHLIMMAHYNGVDIALDTAPYSGGLTTCEALWMGVPVVTRPGVTFASRHSLSHLSNVGLGDLAARDNTEYVDIAVALAEDRTRLAALRHGMRTRMLGSPLCDGPRFAGNFLDGMRRIWRDWCAGAAETR